MKIVIKNIQENPVTALRRAGYHFERQPSQTRRQRPNTDEVSAARSFGAGGFPRFHAYAKLVGRDSAKPAAAGRGASLHINLHLDQKRPVYKGTSAHSGEYEGEILKQEAARIKSILSSGEARQE